MPEIPARISSFLLKPLDSGVVCPCKGGAGRRESPHRLSGSPGRFESHDRVRGGILVTKGKMGPGAHPGSPVLGLLVIPVTLFLGGYVGSHFPRLLKRAK